MYKIPSDGILKSADEAQETREGEYNFHRQRQDAEADKADKKAKADKAAEADKAAAKPLRGHR